MAKRYTITAALPYANGALHLGHLAGVYIPADIYARFLRLQGKDVAFVCGSDEHGAAITIRAKKDGLTPQQIIDHYHSINKTTFERLGISFDIYHRTSEPLHHETAQDFFKFLYEKGGEFEVKTSEQYYDEDFNQFLADRYIKGTCPKCGHDDAYGDQCEKCGSALSPTELIEPKSTMSGKTPVLRPTKHWYFKLDKHADMLREWLEQGSVDGKQLHDTSEWRKHVVGQCLSWLDGGLRPRAISRDLDWGVHIPLEDAEGKVLYVWFDAPIGYISATKEWAKQQGKNWEDYWKSDDTELVHFIGKDNIVFHCIVFPAMLHAHGDYILPKNVPANQFLNLEGKKFSKSKGWVIEQHQYLEDFKDFPNKEDALRYALVKILPESKDGDFKWDDFVDNYDGELADIVGNFYNRAMTFAYKYFEGKVPEWKLDTAVKGRDIETSITYSDLAQQLAASIEEIIEANQKYELKQAASLAIDIARLGNVLFQNNEPWKVYKTNPDAPEIATCVGMSLQIATVLSVVLAPFVPFAASKMRNLLGLSELEDGDLNILLEKLKAGNLALETGHQLGEKSILFTKIRDRKNKTWSDLVEQQKVKVEELRKKFEAAEKAAKKAEAAQKIKPEITFDDFTKIDLRVATIIEATKVKKADKLLNLRLDLGFEQRTVLSGIAEHYQPEELIGQQVVVVANLKPRKMKGIESQGMILMSDNDGKLIFIQPKEESKKGGSVN